MLSRLQIPRRIYTDPNYTQNMAGAEGTKYDHHTNTHTSDIIPSMSKYRPTKGHLRNPGNRIC